MGWFRRRRTPQPDHPRLIYVTRADADAANARLVAAGIDTTFRSHYQGDSEYFVFQGTDVEKAKQWLLAQSVDKGLRYFVVETPDGNWGKDIDGLYLEHLRPWQRDTSTAECDGVITGLPQSDAVIAAARGRTDNFVAEVGCGKCAFTWYDALRYQERTAVRCPACQAVNSVDTGHLVYSPEPPTA